MAGSTVATRLRGILAALWLLVPAGLGCETEDELPDRGTALGPDSGSSDPCDQSPSLSGVVTSSTAEIDFNGGPAEVLLTHRLDPLGGSRSCVGEASLSLNVRGAACALHLEFARAGSSVLRLFFAALETDEGCPEIPAGRSYSLFGGDATLELVEGQPNGARASDCFPGTLALRGGVVLESPSDPLLGLDLSSLELKGWLESKGSGDVECGFGPDAGQ